MDAKQIALLREQMRIQAEKRSDNRWMDRCLKELSRAAIQRSRKLLERHVAKPPDFYPPPSN